MAMPRYAQDAIYSQKPRDSQKQRGGMSSGEKFGIGAGIGGVGAGVAGLFMGDNNNPADAAMPYYQQVPGAVSEYYKPYIDAGKSALPQYQGQVSNLLNNPGQKLNDIGSSFQQSPGFKFALQQALRGSNAASNAGGMSGSPQNQYHNMELATQLGNQDYYHWLDQAKSLYGAGLEGGEHLIHGGQEAGNSFADQIAASLSQQGNLAYASQQSDNQSNAANIQNLFGGAATLAAFL